MASADSEDQPIAFSTSAQHWHRSMLNSVRGGAGGSCVSGVPSDADAEARPSERLPQHPTGLPIAPQHAAFLDSGQEGWQAFLIEDSTTLRSLLLEQHLHELQAGASVTQDFEEWLHKLQVECAPMCDGMYWPTFDLSRVEVLVRLRPVEIKGPSGPLGLALHVARPADTPYFFNVDEVKGMAEQREPAAAATAGLFAAGGAVLVECTSHFEACALQFGDQALPGPIRGAAGPLKWFCPRTMGGWDTVLWAHGASCAVRPGGSAVFYRWLTVRVSARGRWICFPVLAQAAVFTIVPAHPRSHFAERLPTGGQTAWLVFDAVLGVGRSLGLRAGGGPAPASGTRPPARGHRSVGLDARGEERAHPQFEAVAAAAASAMTASGGRVAGVSPEGASPSDAGLLAAPDGHAEAAPGGNGDDVRIVGAGASGSESGRPPSAGAAPSAAGEAVVASEAPRAASREQGPRELMSEITRDYPRLSESRRALPRRRWRPARCSLPPCKAAVWEAVARRLWPRWSRDSS